MTGALDVLTTRKVTVRKKILIIASNYGVWAEELQGPWDALRKAGHEATLATYLGSTPLPGKISMDPEFVDPMQKVKMNPPELLARINEILDDGEWSSPIRVADAEMDDYDALVVVGGAGSALDVAGSGLVHRIRARHTRRARPSAQSPSTRWARWPSPGTPTTATGVSSTARRSPRTRMPGTSPRT